MSDTSKYPFGLGNLGSDASKGFTMPEILVVISISAVLLAILVPMYLKIRSAADAAACQSTMRGYGRAFLLYANENDGKLPRHNNNWKAWNNTLQDHLGIDWQSFKHCPVFLRQTKSLKPNLYIYSGYNMNANLSERRFASLSSPSKTPLIYESRLGGVERSNPYGGWPGGGSWCEPGYNHDGRANILMVDGSVAGMTLKEVDWSANGKPLQFEYPPQNP
jgi:prepilin-type N-terminal cleavage/methylation domain-containing protein/prepilin-type processing-associated H-X9-DG protein